MNLKHIALLVLTTLLSVSQVCAQQYLRIGTGGTAGTYYPVGVLVASVVSRPGKIVATAQSSNGSLGNVISVSSGSQESGFCQADVASWAYDGTGIFAGKPRLSTLRLIANLYPESIQIVVKKGMGIKTVADLRGKRVALDEPGSGTLISARQVLTAYGLTESDLQPEYIKPSQAGDKLKAGTLDAFFFTGGAPAKAISDLVAIGIELLPIDGPQAQHMRKASPFLIADTIAADTYPGIAATPTLSVGAQWVTRDTVDAELVYQATKSLYSTAGQQALAQGHVKGRYITLANAVQGAGIPYHPGALRFYKEVGALK
ncbi:MAG TPA: TAXI family TRAP transporter solute-binding subunit [Rhodoferax sp.]|nr:TAXI family TRAP transporter solute-binding subunit [Rhodoferax sp.]